MEAGIEHKIRGTEKDTKSYNFAKQSSILLYAEGTCCWEIYSRKKFKVGGGGGGDLTSHTFILRAEPWRWATVPGIWRWGAGISSLSECLSVTNLPEEVSWDSWLESAWLSWPSPSLSAPENAAQTTKLWMRWKWRCFNQDGMIILCGVKINSVSVSATEIFINNKIFQHNVKWSNFIPRFNGDWVSIFTSNFSNLFFSELFQSSTQPII